MTLLNGLLAFGAAAFLIPLLIHIFNRSRFRTVEWGAMHLLDSVIKVNHKRFKIEQLILLLVRCAIPILLALCLARPVLTGWRSLEGNAPVSLVILLDNSYSMDAKGDNGSRFDDAVDAACEIIESTSRGSEVAVIQTGGAPRPIFDQPVFDPDSVAQELRRQTGGLGATDVQASLDAATATISGMTNLRRELIVISDFQPADWDSLGADKATAIKSRLDSLPVKPSLTLLPIGAGSKTTGGNVLIESLDFSSRALGVGQRLMLRANLRLDGELAKSGKMIRVQLKIDGVEHSTTQLSIAEQGTSQVLFPCEFETAGSHVVEVEAIVDDQLPTDNRFAASISVWDSINVVIVDGDPSSKPLESESDFLRIALTPYASGRLTLADLIQTEKLPVHEFTAESLNDAQVVVLANVPRLGDDQQSELRKFVDDGGALLVFAGNRMDVNWYNERMFDSGNGLLPAMLGKAKGAGNSDQSNLGSANIASQFFDHPSLEFFNRADNGDLSTAAINRWYALDAQSLDSTNDSGSVMARLSNGDPLLVEKQISDGVVIQCATACDDDWSDMPMRPFFVPLMQQLVTSSAARLSPPRNISTGRPATALLQVEPKQEGVQPTQQQATIQTPSGIKKTIQLVEKGTNQVAQFDNTRRPGVYTMTLPDAEAIHFVATTARTESDLATYDQSQLAATSDRLSATLVKNSGEYLKQDRLRRHGREIWKYLLAGLLVLMFCELALQQRFARVPA